MQQGWNRQLSPASPSIAYRPAARSSIEGWPALHAEEQGKGAPARPGARETSARPRPPRTCARARQDGIELSRSHRLAATDGRRRSEGDVRSRVQHDATLCHAAHGWTIVDWPLLRSLALD
ncbi:hypothetical protein CDD83_9725 [Cordyceps sp. RAO-2017]|nr:hypothetical protein CDD83_9725 [Cordyceps sp. RAO-2017]